MTERGRPTLYGTRMRRINVTLDAETLERIKQLPGSRSHVIRESVKMAWQTIKRKHADEHSS